MAKKLYYKIGEACKLLEIQPYVLRYWETEFQALEPEKSKSGQRTYSEKDLQMIARIKELLYEEGFTIAGAKKKLDAEVEAGGSAALDRTSRKVAAAEAQQSEEAGAPDKPTEPAEEPEVKAPEPESLVATPRKAPPPAAAKAKKRPPAPDLEERLRQPSSAQKLVKLREGIQTALKEARRILLLLDSTPRK